MARTRTTGHQRRRRQPDPAASAFSSHKMFSILVALLLICGSFNSNIKYNNFVAAEDFSYYNADDGNEEYYNQFSVCANSIILVEELSLVCDSPGAYYYGSNKYRNSATCQAGDKAKLQMILEITQDLGYYSDDGQQQQANNGNDDDASQQQSVIPYIYLTAQGYGTVESAYLYDGADLCSLSTLKALDGQTCPAAGSYQLNEVFYWGAQSDNYEYTFTPHVTVGMSSNVDANQYDLGGANTARCGSGNTYTNWTSGITKSTVSSALTTFLITITIAAAVCIFFAIGWYIYHLCHVPYKKKNISQRDVLVDDDYMDEDDMRRIAMMGRERDLIQTVGT